MNQSDQAHMIDAQTAEIIKKAAVRPQERKGWIEDCVRQRADLPHDPTLAAFQMRVEVEMVDVQGRLLPPPQLRYATQSVRQGRSITNCQTSSEYLCGVAACKTSPCSLSCS